MPKLNQKGIVQIFATFILLVGIIAGVYLVQHPQIFKPKAYENNQISENAQGNVIDDTNRPFPNNTANRIFVYLEIKPPTWSSQTEINTLLRVSLDQSKLEKDSDCEITGDPETNCQEIVLDNPSDKLYLSWVLPKKSGNYHIYVRFFSNATNTNNLNIPITYRGYGEIGFEVPTILIGIQSFISSISSRILHGFGKTPASAVFNAIAAFLFQVESAGETIITLSQAQQLGFNVGLTTSEDGEIEFWYDQDQLSKLDIAVEFFPELDPVTNEPMLVILPKATRTDLEATLQATLDIVLGETGGRLAGHLFNQGFRRIADTAVIQTIKSKVRIVPRENGMPLLSPAGAGGTAQRGIGRVAGLIVRNIAKMTKDEQYWYKRLLPLLQTKEAYPLDPNISRPVLDKLISGAELYYSRLGLPRLNRDAIMKTVTDNWVVIVPDNQMSQLLPHRIEGMIYPAFTSGRLVVVTESKANNAQILAHEFVHVISANTRRFGKRGIHPEGIYFNYSQEQADIYGATLSQIYELFTDNAVEMVFGYEGTYKSVHPSLHSSLTNLLQDLVRTSGNKLTYADFSIFALTADDKRLMKAMLDSGINPAEFMRVLDRNIDGRKLAVIMRDYRAQKTRWVIPVGIGGGAVFLGVFFATEAQGEELPEDVSIIYEPLDQDIDLTVTNPQPENYLNCSYSQEDSNCPSGFIVCTGHTEDEQCQGKKPEECFNLVQCQYDADIRSTCICPE